MTLIVPFVVLLIDRSGFKDIQWVDCMLWDAFIISMALMGGAGS